MIYLSSDLHFGHDRGFIYEPRGFSNIQEHDEAIIERFNSIVQPEDDLYLMVSFIFFGAIVILMFVKNYIIFFLIL